MKVICVGVLLFVLVASTFSMPVEDDEDEAMVEEQRPFMRAFNQGQYMGCMIHLAQLIALKR